MNDEDRLEAVLENYKKYVDDPVLSKAFSKIFFDEVDRQLYEWDKNFYRRMYKDNYQRTLLSLKKGDSPELRKFVAETMRRKQIYDKISKKEAEENLLSIVPNNADYNAIMKYKKEMSAKGLSIYGKPIKKMEKSITQMINQTIKRKEFKK